MTWTTYHRQGDVLRNVIATVDARRDGRLPMDVDGVAETFGDPLTLLGALQLRWHTRLAGRVERELLDQPRDLAAAVVAAWQATAEDLPGIRAIIDHYRDHPLDDAMAQAMQVSTAKERQLLAVMAGRAGVRQVTPAAVRIGAELELRARTEPRRTSVDDRPSLLGRLRAALAA